MILTLALACAPRLPPGDAPVDLADDPESIVSIAAPGAPSVMVAALIHTGSAFDPPGQEGLAHLMAVAMAEAGAGDLDAEAFRAALFPISDGVEVVVDREWTSLRLSCVTAAASTCIDRFADLLVAPRFEEATVARLRERAEYELTVGLPGDEEALAHEVLDAALYEAHPYGHPVVGRSGVLSRLGSAELARFHAAEVVRPTVWVGLAGGHGPDDLAHLQARLEALPTRLAPDHPLPRGRALQGLQVVAVDTESPVTGFAIGAPLPVGRDDADALPLAVGMTILGAHRQSFGRLFRTMRTARGLNYGDYAYVEPYRERSDSQMPENGILRSENRFELWVRPTSVENGPFALKLALSELRRFRDEGPTDQEVEDVLAYLHGSIPLWAVSPGRRLLYSLDAVATGTPDPLVSWPEQLDRIDREVILEALQRWIDPDDLVVVAVSGEAAALVDGLVEGRATPCVYQDSTPTAEMARQDESVAHLDLGLDPEDVVVVGVEGRFR